MWNPVAPEVVENPFPFWAWLREEAPVWEVPDAGYFTISRYSDLVEVSRDSETFSSELLAVVQRDDSGRPRLQKTDLVRRPQARVLGVADGEMHARHRRAVGRTFSPSRMERMSNLALEIAERCVADFSDGSEIDAIEALAIPIPLEFMTRLLGLPLEDRPRLQAWTDHAMCMAGGLATAEELGQSGAETLRFQAYLEERFEEELAHPGQEVMGDLARAVRAGENTVGGLERWEAVAVLFQLVVGGIETTVGLIGAAVQHAAQTPAAWSKLRESPESIAAFVEEAVRLDGPATGNLRRTTRDTELGGVRLPQGSTVALLWGSANRDATEFSEPDRFILERSNIKGHLGFGLGKHFCLGAALARMETRVALQALVRVKERVTLAVDTETLRHKPNLSIRRLQSLPIALG
ncbi:MAG: cytochrome P450 [Myxococcota bacterium]|nr:cytochrome P450 [Myxococcota bacterium]